ncbi:Predicted amidohydrolase [Thermosyntropha lipolytica DSM 11003]|uniref:Predicted amidohydrolase n=1 Tax=Thermosyntropha lipolytica DSM 11003 TaxID=1123382 RepID=A0A1M5QAX1_9FIRM|nr:carbon-nitrogen hydrolase family protein [Thermosyntropha lipolytica]SHH10643.1 Predicted amidohydrolase [Thermosyntropha lipolytica DSM 11003]
MANLKVAVCQMKIEKEKENNLKKAGEMISEAVKKGARLVVLPEIFNAPYQTDILPSYAETYPGPTTLFLQKKAKEHKIYLVGGTIPEKDSEGKIYNSSFIFDDKGDLKGIYRKAHLFDVDIPDKITFRESDVFAAGDEINVIPHPQIPFSVLICYDCRFPEWAKLAALKGAKMLIIPAAFSLKTGKDHFELLMRCRAVDNQVYVIAASPARNQEASFKVWGHSMIVDPWGKVIAKGGSGEEVILATLDPSLVDKIRQELPLLKQTRVKLVEGEK